jgi:putative selenium metabolism protein SsnA
MLITNTHVVTFGPDPQLVPDQAVHVVGDRIESFGPSAEWCARYGDEVIVDARGQYVMPGNICAHTHFYGAFARGMAIPGQAPKDFPDILERLWWRLDRALTLEDVRYSALVCLVDAVKHGTTTLLDHHASPNAIDGSLDVIAEAATEAGLRVGVCYEVTDRNGSDGARAGIAENVRMLRRLQAAPTPMLAATFGLHASLSLSPKTLADCRAAHDGGFHIHVAEHEADEYDSLHRYGRRVVDRLRAAGILGPRSIAAHAVHIDLAEAQLLRETGTWVTHQPRSNMNNAVGAADIEGLLRLGVRVCLGNDGFSNAMWEEWKAAYLLHKVVHRDPRRAPGGSIVDMAVTHNAGLAAVFFPDAPLGVIATGAYADLILVDYHPTTPMTAGNLPWHILFGFEPSAVTATIAGGRLLMKDRELLFLDEAEITAKSRERAQQVWARYAQLGEHG